MTKDQYLNQLIKLLTDAGIENRYSLVAEYEKQIDQILSERDFKMKDVIEKLGTPKEIVKAIQPKNKKANNSDDDTKEKKSKIDPEVEAKAKKNMATVSSQYLDPIYKKKGFLNIIIGIVIILLAFNTLFMFNHYGVAGYWYDNYNSFFPIIFSMGRYFLRIRGNLFFIILIIAIIIILAKRKRTD